MKVSTRGRYALRVLIDLAENGKDDYTPMKVIAEHQGLSLKYLEQIVPILTRNQLIQGVHGKGGGYRLSRDPALITVGEVLKLTEGDLAPVACLECNAESCPMAEECRTLPMWKQLHQIISEYLNSVTIQSLMRDTPTKNGQFFMDCCCL